MQGVKYRFSGHQTFVFRHGWLGRGVELIQSDPFGFTKDEALVQLGVGKNMVESIKYWCLQCNLLKEAGKGELRLTELAEFIFGTKGFSEGNDPYLEDDATLWLLHWSMLSSILDKEPVLASPHLAFFRWHKPEFSKLELSQAIGAWTLGDCKVSANTLNRDIDCFVRCYAGTKSRDGEESFDSPFLNLGLLQANASHELFRFNIGAKQNLPVHILGYAILRYMGQRHSLNIQHCLYDRGSPGQAFKLNEAVLINYMLELEELSRGSLIMSETAGLGTINYDSKSKASLSPAEYAKELLNQYYEELA